MITLSGLMRPGVVPTYCSSEPSAASTSRVSVAEWALIVARLTPVAPSAGSEKSVASRWAKSTAPVQLITTRWWLPASMTALAMPTAIGGITSGPPPRICRCAQRPISCHYLADVERASFEAALVGLEGDENAVSHDRHAKFCGVGRRQDERAGGGCCADRE